MSDANTKGSVWPISTGLSAMSLTCGFRGAA